MSFNYDIMQGSITFKILRKYVVVKIVKRTVK